MDTLDDALASAAAAASKSSAASTADVASAYADASGDIASSSHRETSIWDTTLEDFVQFPSPSAGTDPASGYSPGLSAEGVPANTPQMDRTNSATSASATSASASAPRGGGAASEGVTGGRATSGGVTGGGAASGGVTGGGATSRGVTGRGAASEGVTCGGATSGGVTGGGLASEGVTGGGAPSEGVTCGGAASGGVTGDGARASAPRGSVGASSLVLAPRTGSVVDYTQDDDGSNDAPLVTSLGDQDIFTVLGEQYESTPRDSASCMHQGIEHKHTGCTGAPEDFVADVVPTSTRRVDCPNIATAGTGASASAPWDGTSRMHQGIEHTAAWEDLDFVPANCYSPRPSADVVPTSPPRDSASSNHGETSMWDTLDDALASAAAAAASESSSAATADAASAYAYASAATGPASASASTFASASAATDSAAAAARSGMAVKVVSWLTPRLISG